jgi:hypothetical protein
MNIPRLQRQPIDTFVYNQMRVKKCIYSGDLVNRIREIVSEATGFDPYHKPQSLMSEYVKSRQLFMYFVREYAKLSQYSTGRLIGKDHSTVVHAEKSVLKFKDIEKEYAKTFNLIETKILEL